MWKKLPVFMAVLALCACSSAPSLKFPSGSANRVAINVAPAAAAAPAASIAAAARSSVSGTTGPSSGPTRTLANDRPPAPIPVSLFIVNATEQSAMVVMRRWARAARVDFSWDTSVDYPVTPAMREIATKDLPGAIAQMRAALEGVEVPIDIGLGEQGLVITRLAPPPPVAAPEPIVSTAAFGAAPAEASAAVAPAVAIVPVAPSPEVPAAPLPTPVQQVAGATSNSAQATKSWAVTSEKSLRELLSKWAAIEGIEVRWEAARDLPLGAGARQGTYDGDFRHALGQLAGKLSDVDLPLGLRFIERGTVLRVYDLATQS